MAPSRRAGQQRARAPCSSSTATGAAVGGTAATPAALTTTLRAASRCTPSPPQNAKRSWTCSTPGATSTAGSASSPTAAPTRTWSGCHRPRCIAFSQVRDSFYPPSHSAHPSRRGPCRTGSNGSATRSGSTTSPISPEPAASPTPSWTSSPANGSPPTSASRRPPPKSKSCSPTRSTPKACGSASRPAGPTAPATPTATATPTTRSCWSCPTTAPRCEQAPPGSSGPCAPSQPRFGRPGTPTDQAWIETLFGHIKTEWPHLEQITDPNVLRTELDNARHDYNTRRLHASLGYVTPDDEHQGRGDTIRQARQDGLNRARLTRIAYHRNNKPNQP